ncbi:hypothetical protein RJ641_036510 [Dillenia turbinata]|uniref:Uncharacterized protein n=1 Tax=Dillenia turbinata TaxID=194707 RepID=A0AAN8ZCZ8_9MAGN
MKGKLLKKLKSVQPIGYLKQDWILQVSASDGFIESFSQNLDSKSEVQFCNKEEEQEQQQKYVKENTETDQEPDIIDVAELMKELEKEEEIEIDDLMDDKENIGPISIKKDRVQESSEKSKLTENGLWRNKGFEALKPPEKKLKSEKVQTPLSEIDISSFRRPDLNSRTLFDPNLLEAFQQAVMEHMLNEETEMDIRIEEAMPAIRIALEEGNYDGCSSICPECNENGLILCPVCC